MKIYRNSFQSHKFPFYILSISENVSKVLYRSLINIFDAITIKFKYKIFFFIKGFTIIGYNWRNPEIFIVKMCVCLNVF